MTYVPYTKETFPKGNVWISLKEEVEGNSWLITCIENSGKNSGVYVLEYLITWQILFDRYEIDNINGVVPLNRTCGMEQKENENKNCYQRTIEEAHKNGASIQCIDKCCKTIWHDCPIPHWNWRTIDYRVKPEKTWIPWTYETMPEGPIYIRIKDWANIPSYPGILLKYPNLCIWNKAEDVLKWLGHDVITFKNLFDDWRWTATPDIAYTDGGECCGTLQ